MSIRPALARLRRRADAPATLGAALQRGLRRSALAGTAGLAGLAVVQVAFSGVVFGQVLAAPQDASYVGERERSAAAYQARYEELSERYDCSRTGLAPGEIPGSALLNLDGELHAVTFARGWASYEGKAPGSLASVCRLTLDHPRGR